MKTEELYEFIKNNYQNQTFSEIVEMKEPLVICKDIQQDMIVIQYIRLVSRDPQIMYQLVSPNSVYNLFSYLNSMKYFYLAQPKLDDQKYQLLILELLQTIKRVDNKRQVLTDVHSNLLSIFSDYASNIQYLNDILIELIVSLCNYKSYIHKLEEYLVNSNCKQNKLKTMLHIQQNVHKFTQNYNIFRYIFIMGEQMLFEHLNRQHDGQNYLVQYLSILQQMIINKNVKINKLKNQIVYLQFLFDNIYSMDIISQMILLQIIFHLSLDFKINQILFRKNEIHIQSLLVNYQTALNYDESHINQQTQLQREILQQLFRILRQFYIFEKQRQNIKYILDVDILQQFIQIEDIYEIEEYQFLVDNYTKIYNQQYIHRFQSIFNNGENSLALSNMNNNNKINNYQILKKLGKGAYGIVYLVQKDNANQCAMKEIQDKSVFQQELKVVESLNQNNLIKYIEHFQTMESNYIVFEYIDGVSLAQLIEFKRYQQNSQFKKYKLDIKSVVSQLVQGIFYLHKKGIIHRDINPTNIMIDLENRLYLIDFGFGQHNSKRQTVSSNNIFKKKKTRSDHVNVNSSENQITNISNDYIQISQNSPEKEKEQTNGKQFVGTLAYTAPEIVNNQEYDEQIDIWSLGCVFYELLYYKPLYRIENVLQLANEIIKGNIVFEELEYDLFQDRGFVDKLLKITKKCLQKQSNQRISINQIVQEFMEIIIENNEKQNQQTNRHNEYMRLVQKINQKVEEECKEQNVLKQIQRMFNEDSVEYISHFENILQRKKQNVYIGEQMEEIDYDALYTFIYS